MADQGRIRRFSRPAGQRRRRVQPAAVLWLTLVWVLLQGELSLGNVLAGLIIGVVVPLVLPLPPLAGGVRMRPLPALRLLGHFAVDLAVASVQVGLLAYRRGPLPPSGLTEVRLRVGDPLLMTVTCQLLSLVPGSAIVELQPEQRLLTMHLLATDDPEALRRCREQVLAQEQRVVRALGGPAALAELSEPTAPTGPGKGAE